jgi:transcriptional regulator with XRE-family HTH domain
MQSLHDQARAMSRPASPFGRNLARRRAELGLSLEQLAARAGVPINNIRSYEEGKNQYPTALTAGHLARALETSVELLLGMPPATPEPAPLPPSDRDRLDRLERLVDEELFPRDARILRFLGRAGANPAGGESLLERHAATDQFVLEAIGDCLEPEVEEGDLLVLDINGQAAVGRIVALVVNGELHLKRVMQRTTGHLYLWSRRGELTTPEEGVEVLGVIVAIKGAKPIPRVEVTNPGRQKETAAVHTKTLRP